MTELVPLSKESCRKASELEKRCLSTAWSESQLLDITENPMYRYITAIEQGEIVGVGGGICTAPDSCEIFTVAVLPEKRGLGIGKKILSDLIDHFISKEAEQIFLEVEDGNQPAISLYKSAGFQIVGKRKGFYNGKDALIMTKKL